MGELGRLKLVNYFLTSCPVLIFTKQYFCAQEGRTKYSVLSLTHDIYT